MMQIFTYIVNLLHRTDRREHILSQFADKSEFLLSIVPAIEHERGAYGLWQTVQEIVHLEAEKKSDFFVLCEDDHTFTENYSFDVLQSCIKRAQSLNADILSGGYSWFDNAVQISENLFWADKFNGMQFTIIFRKFYQSILDADFGERVITDVHLSSITENKFVVFPYISIQKEFGYSDVTLKNSENGYVDGIFKSSIERLNTLKKVRTYYCVK